MHFKWCTQAHLVLVIFARSVQTALPTLLHCTHLHLLLPGFFKQLLLLTKQFFLGNTQSVQLALASLAVLLEQSKTQEDDNYYAHQMNAK